jgi:uncharacterized protein (TIGR00369 family)
MTQPKPLSAGQPAGLSDTEIRAYLNDPRNASPATRFLGFELIDFSVAAGWATMAFTPRPEMINPIGAVQGGIVTAMIDDAMGLAACLHKRFEVVVPTLSITTNFLRPTPASRVIARGEVLRMNSTTASMQGDLRLPDGTLLATASAAAAVRPFPRDQRTGSG